MCGESEHVNLKWLASNLTKSSCQIGFNHHETCLILIVYPQKCFGKIIFKWSTYLIEKIIMVVY
jgi:hypothetical protein